jgi:hypothetical protein
MTNLVGVPSDLVLSLTVDKDVLDVTGASVSIAPNTGFVWALDAATGQILWTTVAVAGLPLFSFPTVDKDVVIVVTGGTPGVPVVAITMDALTGVILSVVPAP